MDITPGILYVIGSPIGNLGDITIRALDTLKSVDIVLSEDTRETDKLFKKYNIQKPQISYTDQKHDFLINEIIKNIKIGYNYAIISDSGTPLISDPGYKLVNRLLKEGIKCTAIPGPSSPITALSICGLPTDKFVFLGFLPKDNKQREIVTIYSDLDATLIIMESPHRIRKTLLMIHEVLGDRYICLCKDLTKKFEVTKKEKVSYFINNIEQIKEKGEYIILIAKKGFEKNG